jgi:ATP-binding cassette subfamily E protein 1
MYGTEGAYGVVAHPRAVRAAINTYLDGFMREENIRFREYQIKFEIRPPKKEWGGTALCVYPNLQKNYKNFSLKVSDGIIHRGEVVGIVGRNSTGKTTFVKMIAGIISPTFGNLNLNLQISYKPQYIRGDFKGSVRMLFNLKCKDILQNSYFKSEVIQPLDLNYLLDKDVNTLSGGELQRVAIAICLAQDADLYLLDEPSAYLDSNQRMEAARTIRRYMEKNKKSGFIVDHDVYFIDMVSDTIMVFSGSPAKEGFGEGPFEMRTGMNKFLKFVDITFRRDKDTKRPRINKLDSYMDRLQKAKGEYYYFEA